MITDDSMVYCRVCDRWFYFQMHHVHNYHSLDSFVKKLSRTEEGVIVSITANRKEFSFTCIPRLTGYGTWTRYRHQILHETSKKTHTATLQDALDLMMDFISD